MSYFALAVLRSVAWIFSRLSPAWRTRLGRGLGWMIAVVGPRRQVIRENIARAYPAATLEEASRLEHEAYAHLGQLILEALLVLAPGDTFRRFVETEVEVRGADNMRRALAKGKGVLILSSHVGNWELMAAISGPHLSTTIMLATKRLSPAWFHDAIEAGRKTCGVYGAYEPRTMRRIAEQLKAGAMVGIVLDQYAGEPIGIRVPFFGIPVGTSTALAALAKRTGVPVVSAVNYRTPSGKVVVELRPELEWIEDPDPTLAIARNTAYFASIVEADVRAHPEQWLWTHRRFKGDLSPLRDNEWMMGRARRPRQSH